LDKKKEFSKSDLKLFSIFAENAAVSIEKAELYQELKTQTEILKNTVAELKSTQDRLARPRTLKALSNLTSGIAYDFDNTSTAILDMTQLLVREMERISIPEDTKKNVLKWSRIIDKLATNGAETAKNIQAFARTFQIGSEREGEDLDINAIVREAVEVSSPKVKEKVKL
jgi:C4-dicarboxylate-specific signal transduction histidine kinase